MQKANNRPTIQWRAKHLTLALTALFLIVYLTLPPLPLATHLTAPLHTHFTFHFQHGGLWHIATNSYGIYFMLASLQRIAPPHKLLLTALAPATLASFCSLYPTVGASGIVYALVGFYLYAHLFGRLRFISTKARNATLLTLALSLLLGFVIPKIAGTIHLVSMLLGIAFAPLVIQRQPHITLRSLLRW